MSDQPNCPKCTSEYCYENQGLLACPDCGHEWNPAEQSDTAVNGGLVVKDSGGNLLQDGDTITVIKDLKVKGASQPLKMGTKVKGIRLVEGDHNIDCKITGFGAMQLKSEFVKKS
jgi:protein PhnA